MTGAAPWKQAGASQAAALRRAPSATARKFPHPFPPPSTMPRYLISFPRAAMVVPPSELEAVGRDARAVIEAAKAAGVYGFAGGIDDAAPLVRVSADGAVAAVVPGA